MKTSPLPRGGRLLAGMLTCLLGVASASVDDVPRGTLTVDRDLLRVGTRSQLNWQIEYPAPVTSVIEIITPNIIKPKKDLRMRVRVLGASFQQAKSNNGHGNNADGVDSSNPGKGGGGPNGAIDLSNGVDDELKGISSVFLPVEVMWSKNSASWSRIFYGYQTGVNPSAVILDTTVKNNDTINFGGRGWRDGAWLPLYHTAAATKNLVMLKNGDRVPSTVPALNGTAIESFLKPYMDTSTKKVKIGDRDLILLMELGQTNPSNSGFDLQDLVVLVTFE
jgi:hypothetical protein